MTQNNEGICETKMSMSDTENEAGKKTWWTKTEGDDVRPEKWRHKAEHNIKIRS